ncbi:MAG: SRPBCC family protein [Solirubrobacterales bacterium]|nr:SRPBCC family protein [Solirubrobacterales bacterium]
MSAEATERDLVISRVIKAPRQTVWEAWADPRSLEQWWLPAPAKCRVDRLDLVPGGAFKTRMSEDGGDFGPHMDGCFLAVDEAERLIFTTALTEGWRPAENPFITARITLADHPEGTTYEALVMHKSVADRERHLELGFEDGWGTVIGQLAELVEA